MSVIILKLVCNHCDKEAEVKIDLLDNFTYTPDDQVDIEAAVEGINWIYSYGDTYCSRVCFLCGDR